MLSAEGKEMPGNGAHFSAPGFSLFCIKAGTHDSLSFH
jgi:hypothetical protein